MLTTETLDIAAVTDYTQSGSGVAGALNAAKIVFGINPSPPAETKKRVLSDITQSVDADLAPATLTWGAAGRDANGDIVTLSTSVPVKIASDANATAVTCIGIVDSGGTNLLVYAILAVPLSLPDTLALFNIQIPFAPGNPQNKQPQVTS